MNATVVHFFSAFVLSLSATTSLFASDVLEVLPLTDRILMVHFDDGAVVHHKLGENRNSDKLICSPLDVAKAGQASSYTLKSTDDPNYTTGRTPTDVGRKSKGTEFTMGHVWMPDWQHNSWAMEHWLYLFLPDEMQRGKHYTLDTGNLAANGNSHAFTFQEASMRSEAVHVNQIGYLPDAKRKYGYVYHWMGDKGGLPLSDYAGNAFQLMNAKTGAVVFRGELAFRAAATNKDTYQANDTPNGNFLGAEVYECDFSSFTTPGTYILAVEGIGRSFPFEIGEDIYRAPFHTTARGLYHNRSGIELTSEYTEFTRPAPHNPLKTPGFAGKLRYTTVRSCDTQSDGGDGAAIKALVESGDKGPIDTWGWYQDAGDWDGYPTHLRIPALLLLAYEMAPEKFVDNELNIPGKGNGLPDILDEARWLVEYLHRTRHAILKAGYGTGGVSSRVCGDYWGGDMNSEDAANGSWGDLRIWYVFGEDPMSTYMYSGLAGEYAYLLKLLGKKCPTGIDWAKEAVGAFDWAVANTKPGDDNAPHAAISLKNARAYAAVGLYKLTGKKTYHDIFLDYAKEIGPGTSLSEDMRFPVYGYLLQPQERLDASIAPVLKKAVAATADGMVSEAAGKRGCRWGSSMWMPMLVGQATTPVVIDALADYRINGDKESLADAITTLDYFLGTNPLNLIWFTAEKAELKNKNRRYVTGAFHMDSWYNTAKEDREVPGFSPYGPWRQQRILDPAKGQNQGWWGNEWAMQTAYPPIQDMPEPIDNSPTAWPGHERWFNQRYSPLSCENTVHQNTVHWAIATGLLCKDVVKTPFDYSRLDGITR